MSVIISSFQLLTVSRGWIFGRGIGRISCCSSTLALARTHLRSMTRQILTSQQ